MTTTTQQEKTVRGRDARPGFESGRQSRSTQPGPSPSRSVASDAASPDERLVVVVNPSKFTDLNAVKAQVAGACLTHGGIKVRWYETSQDDPGAGQAEQAVREGATMVCSLGATGPYGVWPVVTAGLNETCSTM